jgi:integrative and conjugative element protein (TIGR02256 family)
MIEPTGFGDRFAQWCSETGRKVPDAELRLILNECGARVAADLQQKAPWLVEKTLGLAEFLQSKAARLQSTELQGDVPITDALQRLDQVQYSSVELDRAALLSMLDEATGHGALETGGILAGHVDTKRLVLRITHATPGGPHARREEHFFVGDTSYLQAELNRIVWATAGKSDYLGEWHRHAGLTTHLSPMDSASLKTIAESPQYGTPQPVLVVCGLPDAARREERRITAYTCACGAIYEVPMTVV